MEASAFQAWNRRVKTLAVTRSSEEIDDQPSTVEVLETTDRISYSLPFQVPSILSTSPTIIPHRFF